MYPAKFPGLGEALIFFCLLFFHQGKAPAGAAKFAGYMNGLVPGKLPCPGRGRMRYAPTTGHKKGIPICLGMPFNHSGGVCGRLIPPAT